MLGIYTALSIVLGVGYYLKNKEQPTQEYVCTDTECENREKIIPDVEVMPNQFNKPKELNNV